MENRWNILDNANLEVVETLKDSLSVSEILSKMLVERGVSSFEASKLFFRPSLDHLHDPFLMKGMQKAIDRIALAIKQEEKILVYGDYDVDGTTAVSVVYDFFKQRYEHLSYYIPDRYSEGYGISPQGVEYAAENNYSVVIALDCGIKAIDKIARANELGVDFIICDHHTPGTTLPEAFSIINPKQKDCTYPYKELPGCGIGFKLIQAYAQQFDINKDEVFKYLDLVTVAIGCDIVPITGENRVIAHYGLKKINAGNAFLGVQALIDISDVRRPQLSIEDLVFKIGPRINAAGRIDHGKKAVALLTQPDAVLLKQIAEAVNENNATRRGIDKQITAEALDMMEEDPFYKTAKSTVLFKKDWHKGVVGIVASRLIENHYKPTIVLTESNGKAAGSARSVKGYSVYNAIDACSDLLEQFGGHKYAAGLTIKLENIDAFRNKFEEVVSRTIKPDMLSPEIDIDAEVNFNDITPKFIRILNQFAPFGPQNMKPVFVTRNVVDASRTALVGKDKKHVKFHVKQEAFNDAEMKGIGFSMGEHYDKIKDGKSFDVVYTIEENHWNGNISYEMNVKDLRFCEDKTSA